MEMLRRHVIYFERKQGCERVVIDEMLRYDNGIAMRWVRDGQCAPDAFRCIHYDAIARFLPTMGRWASFSVGARLVDEAELERARVLA